MIRIRIRNLSADLEFETVAAPEKAREGSPLALISLAQDEVSYLLQMGAENRQDRLAKLKESVPELYVMVIRMMTAAGSSERAPLDIPNMAAEFAEGDLQGLFDKIQDIFDAVRGSGVPQASLTPSEVRDPVADAEARFAENQELVEEQQRVAETREKTAKLEPLDAQILRPITFLEDTFNIAFVGEHVYIPVTRAFAFTGFKNAHHLWETAFEAGQAHQVRMEVDPEAKRRVISCVTLAGLETAWSDAQRRMQKRQIRDDAHRQMAERFTTLRNLVIDAGIMLQREQLGLTDDPQKVMYATEEELAAVLNKTQLLNALVSRDQAWSKERLDLILVDQGILRADALTWGKTELGAVTPRAVKEGYVKILSVRCERKESPGQDPHDAYVQRWKPFFTDKTVDYILSGPQGTASNWGLMRVYQLEEAQTPQPVTEQVPAPQPAPNPSETENQ